MVPLSCDGAGLSFCWLVVSTDGGAAAAAGLSTTFCWLVVSTDGGAAAAAGLSTTFCWLVVSTDGGAAAAAGLSTTFCWLVVSTDGGAAAAAAAAGLSFCWRVSSSFFLFKISILFKATMFFGSIFKTFSRQFFAL